MAEMEKEVKEPAGDPHPLFSRKIRNIIDWKEWLDLWQKANTFEELYGLIQTGFNCGTYADDSLEDRICFYFDLADGYNNEISAQLTGDSRKNQKNIESLAKKAFGVLCDNFFASDNEQRQPLWKRFIAKEKIFKKLLWFFRPTGFGVENNFPSAIYTSSKKEFGIINEFLANFYTYVLKYKPEVSFTGVKKELEVTVEKMLAEARPFIVAMMEESGHLKILMDKEINLDDDSMAQLYRMSMTKHWSFNVARIDEYSSLEEAIYFGSRPAVYYKIMQIKKEEAERQKKIKELENQKRIAESELKKLLG